MKRSRNPELKRKQIIDATHQVLREGGYFTKFSLDNVAKAAGVSKGGLMHHFATKDALLQAAARDTIERFEARLAARMGDDTPEVGQMTRAYLELVMRDREQNHAEFSPLLLSYLNSAETDPSSASRFEAWQARTEQDGLDVVKATIVRLAVDGLLYTELIDNRPIDAELREQIYTQLSAMLEE